jgi:hypothetical protein
MSLPKELEAGLGKCAAVCMGRAEESACVLHLKKANGASSYLIALDIEAIPLEAQARALLLLAELEAHGKIADQESHESN